MTNELEPFQFAVMVAAGPGTPATGAHIRAGVEDALGRPIVDGALYATLNRLTAKGLLSKDSAASPIEFKVTRNGRAAIERTARLYGKLAELAERQL